MKSGPDSMPAEGRPASAARLYFERPLAVRLRREATSPPLATEPVRREDLSLVLNEGWRDAYLRKGFPDVPLSGIQPQIIAQVDGKAGTRCSGFDLELTLPNGRRKRLHFPLKSLAHVARRAVQSCITRGVLKNGQSYTYELVVNSAGPLRPSPETGPVSCTVSIRTPPLAYLQLELRPLLELAAPVDLQDDDDFPVFYVKSALARAEACSRHGMKLPKAVETGGVLVGALASCPVSGEFFTLVTDALEALEAEQTAFSLSYSSTSWTKIQNILRAQQAAFPQRCVRILGQAHGHNFMPHEDESCRECPKRAVCDLTSVFVSQDDQAWMQAVFARQPALALCHIFGLSARAEPVSKLYSLRQGRWEPRGYYVLPEMDLDTWKPKK